MRLSGLGIICCWTTCDTTPATVTLWIAHVCRHCLHSAVALAIIVEQVQATVHALIHHRSTTNTCSDVAVVPWFSTTHETHDATKQVRLLQQKPLLQQVEFLGCAPKRTPCRNVLVVIRQLLTYATIPGGVGNTAAYRCCVASVPLRLRDCRLPASAVHTSLSVHVHIHAYRQVNCQGRCSLVRSLPPPQQQARQCVTLPSAACHTLVPTPRLPC
jgi:hypothetical protein